MTLQWLGHVSRMDAKKHLVVASQSWRDLPWYSRRRTAILRPRVGRPIGSYDRVGWELASFAYVMKKRRRIPRHFEY
eukprot:6409490-Prorocentrum_lima.AAC.1